ncbi:LysM peptidoglycan-binding domain-containing protein [Vagococcus entomophilus]|uniref:Peptidoglycan hydrolase n=1 Tax=Vagococcus entomophilus TaxID=1160095 RepID=A0A430AGB9_9ENTE|nr:LysM peptidoglycan-binding domain-containing protein [Vagococcus entomophilus]RSU06928.1 hypothetical protein CBF30_06615 [Vagococcus entomophilus]
MKTAMSRKELNKDQSKQSAMPSMVKGISFFSTALAVSSFAAPSFITTAEAATANTTTFSSGQLLSPSSFLAQAAEHARSVADANDLYASVMIAQSILESGWGQSALGSAPNYNLFGIKGSYQGNSVTMSTSEFLNGQWTTVNAQFRKYPSYRESFQDNANVIRNTSFQSGVYYYSGAWKSNTKSYRDATAWLTGRYATDPGYAGKLNSLIEAYNLTQYDTPASGNNNSSNNDSDNGNGSDNTNGGNSDNSNTNTSTYTVVSGDTLYRIALKNGVSVADIKSWNSLTSDTIYIGQKLSIKGSSNNNNNNSNNSNSNNNNGESNNNSTNASTYTVVSGDTLYRIALKNGVSVANIKSWNNLTSDTIYVGQKLSIKGSSSNNNNSNNSSNNTNGGNSSNGGTSTSTYTVVSGDTLYRIASKNGVSVANIKSWNSLTSDTIYVGQKLAIKGAASANQNNNSSTPTNNGTNNNTSNSGATDTSTYTVASGDTLYRIASNKGVSVANIKSWNNLTSDTIYVGQKLSLKGASVAQASQTTPTNTTNTNTATPTKTNATSTTTDKKYKVVSNDTLYRIAKDNKISLSDLKSWNNLTNDNIFVGQELIVAKGSTTPTTAPATNSDTYKVASGDTLYNIAKKHNISLQQLKSLNSMSTDLIVVGQTLRVK